MINKPKMKKILFTLVLIGILVLPVIASAGGLPATATAILDRARKAVWSIFVFAAIVMFLYAGILFLTSAGDPEKMSKAKKAVFYGVIGLVVAVLAYSAVTIIKTITG